MTILMTVSLAAWIEMHSLKSNVVLYQLDQSLDSVYNSI